MGPTQGEIDFFENLIHSKEKEVRERLGMREPPQECRFGIVDLSAKHMRGSYSPKCGSHEDIYLFDIGSSKEGDIEEVVLHEAIHRHYFWNIAMNSNQDISPSQLWNLEEQVIKTRLARGDPSLAMILSFFNETLSEIFAYYCSMAILGREAEPIEYVGVDSHQLKAFFQMVFSTTEKDITQLVWALINVHADGSDLMEYLPNSMGHEVGTAMYRKLGSGDDGISLAKNFFIGYDITKGSPDDFNPIVRYMRLCKDFSPA